MTAAIFFDGDSYSTAGPKLMGRNAAGASFLKGYVAHATTDRFWLQSSDAKSAQPFADAARAAGRSEPITVIPHHAPGALEQAGTLYYPAPDIVEHARRRAVFGEARWSLCGITHTTASAGAMDSIAALLSAPVHPWDAVICTSKAVRGHVDAILQAEAARLARRTGATRFVAPQLPIIPLGINTADFAVDEGARAAARAALGIAEDVLVVLYAGRLSFHAKAHPAAMYAAIERAARGRRVVLIECGWFPNDAIEASFDAAAALLAPSIELRRLDGRVAEQRAQAWGAADVFCSLSDNIQETFGLTPLEAMAAGLPVVVTDWDGYRDTVRDGIDGFCVPTMMPAAGLGGDLAVRHAFGIDTYDRYCGHASLLVAVDIGRAAEAFARLFDDPALRRQMGAAGQARARADYDWAAIVPRYEALWRDLAGRRATDGAALRQPQPAAWPQRMDPFDGFAGYPSVILRPDTALRLAAPYAEPGAATAHLRAMMGLFMIEFARPILPGEDELVAMIEAAAGGAGTAGAIVEVLPEDRRAYGLRALSFLAKLGILAFDREPER